MSNLSKTDNYDVVIVGMGPTGLVLANLLGLEELNVLVIDKFLTPYDLPRACLLYTSPSPRDLSTSRMPSSA